MKALARATLVVLLVFTVTSSIVYVSCANETVVPYEFPAGLINIIQHSENPETPFWYWVEETYPLVRLNYTVQQDGWLDISSVLINGSRPEIILNDKLVYRTNNPLLYEQVYAGDFYELVLFPPEYLNNTFSMEIDDRAMTVYELYTWDAMIGELVFSEVPRTNISAVIDWTPRNPVEDDSVIFSVLDGIQDFSWVWSLEGIGLSVSSIDSHFITDSLDYGNYTISLFVEDTFGLNDTFTKDFTVLQNSESILYDPSKTSVDVVDMYCPSSSLPDEIIDATVEVCFNSPVSRDIRVSITDSLSGEVLSVVEDQLTGETSNIYVFSFISASCDMSVESFVEFLHEDEWILSGESRVSTIQVVSPAQNSSIPGFPEIGLAVGLLVYVLKRKYW